MVKPSDVDRMPDQNTQNLEDRKRGAWSVNIGLQYAGNDPLARQPCHASVAVLRPERFDPGGVPDLRGLSQAQIR